MSKSVDCISLSHKFIENISTYKSDYDILSPGQTIINTDSTLNLSSINLANYEIWRNHVDPKLFDKSLDSIDNQSSIEDKNVLVND